MPLPFRLTSLGVLLVTMLAGCYPSLQKDRYFRYQLAVEIDGQRREFQQNFACHPVNEFSEGDGKFHLHWYQQHAGGAAAGIGDDRAVMYLVGGLCDGPDRQDLMPSEADLARPWINASIDHPLYLFQPAAKPTRMLVFKKALVDPAMQIANQSVTRLPSAPDHLGPSASQEALMQALADTRTPFYRVIQRELPRDVWAISDDARQYFAKFRAVTLAPHTPGAPEAAFPLASGRRFPRKPDGQVAVPSFELNYDGTAFEIPTPQTTAHETWYRVASKSDAKESAAPTQPPLMVRYHGQLIEIHGWAQEIFDPERQVIVSFEPSTQSVF